MTDMEETMETRIWTPTGFIEDDWRKLGADEPLPDKGKAIIPAVAFIALAAENRKSVGGRIGVVIEPADELDNLAAHLSEIGLIALSFPTFSDGRAYSKATLLKSRYGYKGVLRATGDILVDQVALMIRVGFDELEISNPVALSRLAEGRVGGLGLYYQPGQREEARSDHYSWRRSAA